MDLDDEVTGCAKIAIVRVSLLSESFYKIYYLLINVEEKDLSLLIKNKNLYNTDSI